MTPTLGFCLAVLLVLSSAGFAKGVTTRILYERALQPTEGFVYFPGNSHEHYRLNVRAIHRGADVEGHWFRASASWQAAIGPLLSR